METKSYTNEDLARDFVHVRSQESVSTDYYRSAMDISTKISKLEIDLSTFYKQKGNLKGIPGISYEVRKTLELILKRSGEDAKSITIQQAEKAQRLRLGAYRVYENPTDDKASEGSGAYRSSFRTFEENGQD